MRKYRRSQTSRRIICVALVVSAGFVFLGADLYVSHCKLAFGVITFESLAKTPASFCSAYSDEASIVRKPTAVEGGGDDQNRLPRIGNSLQLSAETRAQRPTSSPTTVESLKHGQKHTNGLSDGTWLQCKRDCISNDFGRFNLSFEAFRTAVEASKHASKGSQNVPGCLLRPDLNEGSADLCFPLFLHLNRDQKREQSKRRVTCEDNCSETEAARCVAQKLLHVSEQLSRSGRGCVVRLDKPKDGIGSQIGYQVFGLFMSKLLGCEYDHVPIEHSANSNLVNWDFETVGSVYCHPFRLSDQYSPPLEVGFRNMACYGLDWEAWTGLKQFVHRDAFPDRPTSIGRIVNSYGKVRIQCDEGATKIYVRTSQFDAHEMILTASHVAHSYSEVQKRVRAAWHHTRAQLRQAHESRDEVIPLPSEVMNKLGSITRRTLDVVVHARMGDMFKYLARSSHYYSSVMCALAYLAHSDGIPLRFHVLGEVKHAYVNSSLVEESFDALHDVKRQNDGTLVGILADRCEEKSTSQPKSLQQVRCHFNGNPAFALELMTRADILVLSHSTFSWAGVAFGKETSLKILLPKQNRSYGTFLEKLDAWETMSNTSELEWFRWPTTCTSSSYHCSDKQAKGSNPLDKHEQEALRARIRWVSKSLQNDP